jgi:flagellar biosynthetic protein FlhB
MSETEQNKSEEPTPFKLKRAREKGTVARGTDLGFFSALAGLALFALISGVDMMMTLAETMRRILATSIGAATDQAKLPQLLGAVYGPAVQSITIFACSIALVVLLFEIVQVRGLLFSSKALKPDFSRLNPAKGIKRLFSKRMLKETIKNILKLAIYATASILLIQHVFISSGAGLVDADRVAGAMHDGGMRLLFMFVLLALLFAAVDQVMARREFLKQMRMSRSELTREVKEREGEPRLKRRRKELHAEFAKQTSAMGNLHGSDMLIVNPQHYAVALAYDARTMEAPRVAAKGRNGFAQMLKERAAMLSIPIFEAPPLARSLYRQCQPGDEVPGPEYRAVVELYLKVAAAKRGRAGDANA